MKQATQPFFKQRLIGILLFFLFCATAGAQTERPCTSLPGSLTTGVIAFYPFGNGSLLDLSGNGNNLINNTTVFPASDRMGNATCAYHFESVNNDSLFLPASSCGFLNNLTVHPFSISFWYKPTGTQWAYELLAGRGSSGRHCPDGWGGLVCELVRLP